MFGTPKGVNDLWTKLLMLKRKVRDWLKNVSNHSSKQFSLIQYWARFLLFLIH